jgi:3-hydroxyacyl-[acyl-carrier-protein] dehydratase
MLKDDFYTIISIKKENNSFEILLGLNGGHAIFLGHFPGHPVVPGACLLQMVKEVTEDLLAKKLQLIKADNIKFLMLINPNEQGTLQMNLTHNVLEDGSFNVVANLMGAKSVCFKFSGRFQAVK